MTKNSIQSIVSLNSNRLKAKKLDIKITEAADIKNRNGLKFEVRHFQDGPAPQEFEAVAYHAGKGKSVLMAVLSALKKNDSDMYSLGH